MLKAVETKAVESVAPHFHGQDTQGGLAAHRLSFESSKLGQWRPTENL